MHLVFPSTLLPDVQSDPMGLLLSADQVHVVGNEELASAGYRGAPRRYEHSGTEVRRPIILLQLQEREKKKHCGNIQFSDFTSFYSSYWFLTGFISHNALRQLSCFR